MKQIHWQSPIVHHTSCKWNEALAQPENQQTKTRPFTKATAPDRPRLYPLTEDGNQPSDVSQSLTDEPSYDHPQIRHATVDHTLMLKQLNGTKLTAFVEQAGVEK